MLNMDYFLIFLGFVYVAIASLQDLKKREVWNWLNFSLIAFALAYRAFYAIVNSDSMFFIFGLAGVIVAVALGYAFYYSRVFAGGDAKLLMGLGAVIPLADSILGNVIIFVVFIFLLMASGSLYGILWSFGLVLQNKRVFWKEFRKQIGKYRKLFYVSVVLFVLFLIFPVITRELVMIVLPVIILIFPLLYTYAKAVEESCMVVLVKTGDLTEGDWLYQTVRVGKKTIKPNWEGLSTSELKILKKKKGTVLIKQGIPFVPAFFFALLFLACLLYSRLEGFSMLL